MSSRQSGLFGEEPARELPLPSRLLAAWGERFRAGHSEPYHFARGRDARALRDLEATFGWPLLLQLMDDFFASPDPFIRDAGHTVAVFCSQANKLAQRRSTLQQPLQQRSVMLAAFEELDRADAARGRR